MIEPCLCGCATVVGPYTENFRPVMSDLLEQRALLQGKDAAETESLLLNLLSSPSERTALGARATQAVNARRGTTPRIARDLLSALPGATPAP